MFSSKINVQITILKEFSFLNVSSGFRCQVIIQGHWWDLLAKTTWYDPSSFLWMFSLLSKELIFDFYLYLIFFSNIVK